MQDRMKNFTFIPDNIQFEDFLPYCVLEGFTIKKANEEQASAIDAVYKGFGTTLSNFRAPYYKCEYEFGEARQINKNEECKDKVVEQVLKYRKIPRKEWHCYIVEYDQPDQEPLRLLQLSANLLEFAMNFDVVDFEFEKYKYYPGFQPDLLFMFFYNDSQFVDSYHRYTVTKYYIDSLKNTHSIVEEIKQNFPEIYHSINLFNEIRYIRRNHQFRILGLFSTIESLLTHNPYKTRDNMTLTSITKQIQTKIPLVENQFNLSHLYKYHFGGANKETVWKKLYDLRSSLAHGTKHTFDGDLQILKDMSRVQHFLYDCTRSLLANSLQNPQLITDLKRC